MSSRTLRRGAAQRGLHSLAVAVPLAVMLADGVFEPVPVVELVIDALGATFNGDLAMPRNTACRGRRKVTRAA